MTHNTKCAPTVLVVLDGFGFRKDTVGNGIASATMPTWHFLLKNYPNTLLQASGKHVGLLPGYIGNSEVGHLTIGAGRIIPSILKRFHDSITNGSFFYHTLLIEKFKKFKEQGKALHLMGLLSDGGVHSHEAHLYALIKLASQVGLSRVYVHAFLDGRDVSPQSAELYLQRLEDVCKTLRCGNIASLHGRFYAMDRDNNIDRTNLSYDLLMGKAKPVNLAWHDALYASYQQKITDEFFYPTLLDANGYIKPGDGVVFFNFRPDRARQLTQCFLPFEHLAFFISTTRYQKEFTNDVLFEQPIVSNTLLDEIATQTSKKVFIIAETEKYAHVTYFFKGMRDEQFAHEQRVLVPSIKAHNYVEHPAMSAPEITEKLFISLRSDPAYFYLLNYANADMVGHSGNLEATIKACECIDQQLARLYEEVVEKQGGTIFITADHGNAEEKIDSKTGKIRTAHTINPVPFVAVGKQYSGKIIDDKEHGLAYVAPTILKHLRLRIPVEMSQNTII